MHAVRDGVVSSYIPFRLRSSEVSRCRCRVAVEAAGASSHALVSRTRFSPRKALVVTSVNSEVETWNCRDSSSASDENSGASANTTSVGKTKRVFLLDVNPICYDGARPDPRSFARWLTLFFAQVSLRDPVIAVLDGDNGNDYRKRLLPSYKAHRRKFSAGGPQRTELYVSDVLRNCNVPVVKVNGYEADDIVATLTDQAVQKGLRVVIASPDKDFKQLISEDVQIVMPVPELKRWSFYTLKHYLAQYDCYPSSDLSLRCILGDEADGVPGIQQFVPNFGRKTAVKLVKKHGSLESLLNTAAIKTVAKQYAQDALNKYADHLRRNYQVLSLRRDADVHLREDWLSEREIFNDSAAVSEFLQHLSDSQQRTKKYVPSRSSLYVK